MRSLSPTPGKREKSVTNLVSRSGSTIASSRLAGKFGSLTPPVTLATSSSTALSAAASAPLAAAAMASQASSSPSCLRNSGSTSTREILPSQVAVTLTLSPAEVDRVFLVFDLLFDLLDLALHARRLAHQLVHPAAKLHGRLSAVPSGESKGGLLLGDPDVAQLGSENVDGGLTSGCSATARRACSRRAHALRCRGTAIEGVDSGPAVRSNATGVVVPK